MQGEGQAVTVDFLERNQDWHLSASYATLLPDPALNRSMKQGVKGDETKGYLARLRRSFLFGQ